MQRRTLLESTIASVAMAPFGLLASGRSEVHDVNTWNDTEVNFAYDGYLYSPSEYVSALSHVLDAQGIEPDFYGNGGACAAIEERMRRWTGMEAAVFMPSGTMANNLAVRVLARDRPVVFVPERSHLLNSEADAAQALHAKRLLPLGAGKPYFSPEEFRSAVNEHRSRARFGDDVGAAVLEIACRAEHNRTQSLGEMQEISTFAREQGIPLHLDGARIHSARAWHGIEVAQYCALFDTVYMDLYKYFRAAYGAVLCGPRSVVDQMRRYIKMCGGSLIFNWPAVAVADYFANGFEQRFSACRDQGLDFIAQLNKSSRLRVLDFADGTNVYELELNGVDPQRFVMHLRDEQGIRLRMSEFDPETRRLPFKINETQLQRSSSELLSAFSAAEAQATLA